MAFGFCAHESYLRPSNPQFTRLGSNLPLFLQTIWVRILPPVEISFVSIHFSFLVCIGIHIKHSAFFIF
jgi:hypothetical protein